MKSNQLNAIALLLLATAGISAANEEATYNAVQHALDIARTGKGSLTLDESNLIGGNIHTSTNVIDNAKNKTPFVNDILRKANPKATLVQRNKARLLRNVVDPIVRNKSTILKAAAAVAAVTATAYAVDRYGFEGKGLVYTKDATSKAIANTKTYGSWLYSKLPAKPTWLVMPAFVSNLFAKKTVETPTENKPVETPAEDKKAESTFKKTLNVIADQVQTAKDFVVGEVQTATKELKASAQQLKTTVVGKQAKLDLSGSEMI